ncbi:uncharacterized protein DSM5745_03269 [Aspergillus mulundensis]|uniref:Uncharacterized protein n=1 Tax=Aspergillus mulundensis TaxID=1810919 RepID=A0A3D8SJX0_9EURO|nr:Uncharacterized protein DSM5745_03269 [Aspergillus mulundensis]RDW86627.1 Uncharacterized protein DSM5745_03269 [Aspergillus mulundensis]
MSSPTASHTDYNPRRPGSPGHVPADLQTVTLDPEVLDQQASNTEHKDSPAPTPAAWGIGWQCPAMMVGSAVCGALVALGHHIYYNTLDTTRVTSVEQQTWAVRIGTGLAFISRAFLVAAVGAAAAQETWATLRKKSIRLYGINNMFSILNNPMAFLSLDIWLYAKTLTVLAIVSWLIPLAAVITPATLSVRLRIASNETRMQVPTIDFALNTTWDSWMALEGTGRIESYLGYSPDISRLFAATSVSISVLPVSAPLPNSSYTLDFWGPSYRCERLNDVVAQDGSIQDIWNTEISGDIDPDFTIYIGTQPSQLNNTIFVYAAGSNPVWNAENATQPTELVCQLWNTSYVVSLNFSDGVQALTPISTTPSAFANWSTEEATESAYKNKERVNAGFHIVSMLFQDLLHRQLKTGATGSLRQEVTGHRSAQSSISITQTGLFSCPDLWNSSTYEDAQVTKTRDATRCRNKTLARAIEDLSHNFTYSLLSLNSANTSVNVTSSFPQNYFSYNQRNLLAAYIVSVGVTVGCVVVGFLAMHRNGISQNTSFSTVLLTTRNPELDGLAVGNCLGSDKMGVDVGKVRLRFGEIEGAGEYRHAAFGTKASVTPISKGREYY